MEISKQEYEKLKKFWDNGHKAQRKWEERNKERRKEYMKQWQQKNKEHIKEYQKKYYGRVDNETKPVIIGEEQC